MRSRARQLASGGSLNYWFHWSPLTVQEKESLQQQLRETIEKLERAEAMMSRMIHFFSATKALRSLCCVLQILPQANVKRLTEKCQAEAAKPKVRCELPKFLSF